VGSKTRRMSGQSNTEIRWNISGSAQDLRATNDRNSVESGEVVIARHLGCAVVERYQVIAGFAETATGYIRYDRIHCFPPLQATRRSETRSVRKKCAREEVLNGTNSIYRTSYKSSE